MEKHLMKSREKNDIMNALIKKSKKIKSTDFDCYAYPTEKILVREYEKEKFDKMHPKRIIFLGETGSGKSTLINAMVNYAAGVDMNDTVRFKLITGEDTNEITGYFIGDENSMFDYPLLIWDTPGFGDTGTNENNIIEKVNELLKKEKECAAICFVVKGNVTRLTEIHQYIIHNVLNFFGKDVRKNMYILATHGDFTRPCVLNALKESDFPFHEDRWLEFNNSELFKTRNKRNQHSQEYWDYTVRNVVGFHNKLAHEQLTSLAATCQVIEEKEKLKRNIKAISEEIDRKFTREDQIKEYSRKIEVEKRKIREYTKMVSAGTKIKIPTNNITTFCTNCTFTCHEDCSIADNSDKARCWAMTNGYCRTCPKNCKWDWHQNQPFIYKDKDTKTVEAFPEKKEEFEEATKLLDEFEGKKNSLETEKQSYEQNLCKLVEEMRAQSQSLKEMAILEHPMEMSEYFKKLAEEERKKGNLEKAEEYEKLA